MPESFSKVITGNLLAKDGESVERHVPGEVGVWVIIIGDMVVFGLLFVVFLYYRSLDLDLFIRSQASLNVHMGAANTLVLLLSSLFVAKGVQAARRESPYFPNIWFALAISCGLAFVVLKIVEYRGKIAEGLTLFTNDFFMYYYVLTGIHLVHVLIGITVLFFMWKLSKSPVINKSNIQFLEGGASFWHMVDLLWIVLFPLLYLIR